MTYKCPICKKPTDSEKDSEFPFCSERCRLLDLGAWSSEKYVVSDPIFNEDEIPETDRRALHERKRDDNETIH
ncbi:MAG: DNA gyrase inhibitor YacG [Candidatus Acidiferrum sp.]